MNFNFSFVEILFIFILILVAANLKSIFKILLSPFRKMSRPRVPKNSLSFLGRIFQSVWKFAWIIPVAFVLIGVKDVFNNLFYVFSGSIGETLFFIGIVVLIVIAVWDPVANLIRGIVQKAPRRSPRASRFRRSMFVRENDPISGDGMQGNGWTSTAQ